MRCKDTEKHIDAYLDGTLDLTVRSAFDEHLKTCLRCHDVMNRRQKLIGLLQPTPVPPFPENLTLRIMAGAEQIARGSQPESVSELRPSPLRAIVFSTMKFPAAAALVIGLALGLLMAKETLPRPSANATVSASAGQPDAFASFNLDNLTDSPSGSLPDVYISMISRQGEGER